MSFKINILEKFNGSAEKYINDLDIRHRQVALTIKIIDEYGNVIDLNDDKISLTFEVTKIYQF